MIHRFFIVTYGYLRFTLFCTIGATALFALTGLAISSPLVFLLVALVAVLGFFVYRSERELYLRAHKPSRPQDLAKLETKAFAEWLSFATAADVLLSSITDKTKLEAGAIWVLEYKYISLKNPNVSLNTPVDDGEQLRIALEIFQQHRKAFLSHGFYPLYVSKEPAGHIIATIRRDNLYRPIVLKNAPSPEPVRDKAREFSIVFAQDKNANVTMDWVEKILQDSFEPTGGGIIDLTSKVSKT